jgi:hypothetical protein
MRVGVAEIMETGHITLAETICRIFYCDPGNQVFLFTLDKHAEYLAFLSETFPNIVISAKPSGKKMEEFLNDMETYALDRIYLVTLTKHFRIISKWQLKTRLFLIVHNIDEWFGISPGESFKKFLYSVSGSLHGKLWIYFFKVNFIFPLYKKNILEKVQKSDGRLVVLSRSLQNKLDNLNINIASEVIPFSVFNPSLANVNTPINKQLRICVPGILSQYRRNYLALFDLLETQLAEFKTLFVLDLLGGMQIENQFDSPASLLGRIDSLKSKGFSIIVHSVQFIPPVEYDLELSKADIIVGNMNVALNKFSSYGKTKETGIPFAMIRAAKPGILPEAYPFPDEITTSTLVYKDFKNLGEILSDLISARQKIEDLKKKALENSKKFSPESIYNQILDKQHL